MSECKDHSGRVTYDPSICWACVLDERDALQSRLSEKEKVIERFMKACKNHFSMNDLHAAYESALQEGEGKEKQ